MSNAVVGYLTAAVGCLLLVGMPLLVLRFVVPKSLRFLMMLEFAAVALEFIILGLFVTTGSQSLALLSGVGGAAVICVVAMLGSVLWYIFASRRRVHGE